MVIRLDGSRVNISSCKAVLEHVRGRVIFTTVSTFVKGHTEVLAPLGNHARRMLDLFAASPVSPNTYGFSFKLNVPAMVWHAVTIQQVLHGMQTLQDTILAVPTWIAGEPTVFVTSRLLLNLCPQWGTAHWQRPLPNLNELLRETWPCIADVFCAISGLNA